MKAPSQGLKSDPSRILVRGVNWLGDAVMTTPALRRLRERFPEAHLALLTHRKLADLWTNHPSLNEVITFDPEDSAWAVGRRLRAGHFDLAIILPNSPRSAFECWRGRIPERIGYARPWRNWFLTRPVPTRSGHKQMVKRSAREISRLVNLPAPPPETTPPDTRRAHHIHEYLELVARLGAKAAPLPTQLAVQPEEIENVRRKFGLPDASTDARLVLGLNPGAEYGPAKRWPVEKFIAAARAIQQHTPLVWVVFGGPPDRAIAEVIETALASPAQPVLNLAGRTSLRELMALLASCRVLLTNDTGPMHVAAALGTPVVVPFGSTSPELTGPGLPGDPKHRLVRTLAPCSPCFLRECPIDFRCMASISVEQVVKAALSVNEISKP